jgi:hypothetical protein
MRRRTFLTNCATAGLLATVEPRGQAISAVSIPVGSSRPDGLAPGQPVNLASYGELQSWLAPSMMSLLQAHPITSAIGKAIFNLVNVPWPNGEFDVGVQWSEFRTIEKIAIEYVSPARAPAVGKQILEYWDGITGRQGTWRSLRTSEIEAIPVQIDGRTWSFSFPALRTCKVRVRFQNQHQVEISRFAVYGPSKWRSGKIRLEWGYRGPEQSYDGKLERYNGEILGISPIGATRLTGSHRWASTAGEATIAGIEVHVLYAWGMDVDRTILTLRTKACDLSFLPGEVLEEGPIDAPDFGVYIRKSSLDVDRAAYRRKNAGKLRIVDATASHPEQDIENAFNHIKARRVTLSFVGIDSNSHKFGIAPDGHFVIGNNDPSCGHPIVPQFAMYFDTSEQPSLFQKPEERFTSLFKEEKVKRQRLHEGWLPILITEWSENDLAFERTDYAALQNSPEIVDESKLMGNEAAVVISSLTIRNNSTEATTAGYFIKPWKPVAGPLAYGPIPPDVPNAWSTTLDENIIRVTDDVRTYAICFVDTQGRGQLSAEPWVDAARYSVLLGPGEKHTIYSVIPGEPIPLSSGVSPLQNLAYENLKASTVRYWNSRLSEGMQVEIPHRHLQNLYSANIAHWFLALTKDGHRGEHYPNTAVFYYGSIGSESSPVMQVMDMRGLHDRAETCLKAWLSTQGDALPSGDYQSKQGGFFHFWPNYTVDQGSILWTLAEHYLYTRDQDWLRRAAPEIVAGCDFIIRARSQTKKLLPGGKKPLSYGLAPAGCVADPRDWEYSFMLNGYFYLGLKKSAQVLHDVDPGNATRIAAEAEDYLHAIRTALRESIIRSPVTRLRDNTSIPSVPSYLGLRGFSSDVKDSADPDRRHGYAYDVTIGPFHLLKTEVVDPGGPEVTSMLNYLEDYFFMFTPLPSRVELDTLATDWFNMGGFGKLQPYYCYYQEAYLLRDQIPNFLRGFFNTLAAISDPQTLTFQEELDFGGGQPNKTHEEAWFMHQFRYMLLMEVGDDLFLARGTPRSWLEDGKQISVTRAPSYFGELTYKILSHVRNGSIEATVSPPRRNRPANLYLRLRHPERASIKRVIVNGRAWNEFNSAKEWITLPTEVSELTVTAYYG